MSTVRRAIHALALLAIVLVVVVFAVQAFPQAVGADHSYVVLSSSMEPTISPGDVVIVSETDPTTIAAGDVITYRQSASGTPITHRVLDVVETENGLVFETKGDANEDPDPKPVDANAVIGTVVFTIPLIGHVVLFANTTLGSVLLIGLPFLLLGLAEAIAIARDGETEDGEPAAPDASTATEDAETVPEADDTDDGITVTTMDLRLSAIVLVAFAVYAGRDALSEPTAVSIATTVGTAAALLVVVLVYLGGESMDSPTGSTDPLADGGVADDEAAAAGQDSARDDASGPGTATSSEEGS